MHGFVYNFFQHASKNSVFRRLLAGRFHEPCSLFIFCRKMLFSVELSTNKVVFDDRIVKASFPGSIRQKAVNCLFNDKILSFV